MKNNGIKWLISKSGGNPVTAPPSSRPISEFLKGRLVVGSGLDANCSDKLIEAIQRSSKLFDSVMASEIINRYPLKYSKIYAADCE
jgi:hypothetical protein